MPEKKLLSVREVCNVTGLGKTKVTELLLTGEIPSILVGRRRLTPEVGVDEFIKRKMGERRPNLKAV